MTLFSHLGAELSLGREQWDELLRLATAAGWKPQGTQRPPVRFDGPEPEWNGDYARPEGQTVSRTDAAALAHALENTSAKPRTFSDGEKKRIVRFLASGPFIISLPFGMNSDIANLDSALRGIHKPVQPAVVASPSPESAETVKEERRIA